jgi:aryl-alcohol dehydrogenase-like predicted oxidoreductase
MRTFTLPGLAKTPSVLCLGAAEYGSRFAEDEAFALLDAFAQRGGTFADTAHVYADWLPHGTGASERTLGRWINSRGMAGQWTVGTKGAHPRLETMDISRLNPADIAQDLNESRERLGLDAIDLYWLHRDDPAVPVGEIVSALNRFLADGSIRALGASNWSTTRLQEANAYAAAHALTGFCASQIAWSLARRNTPYDAAQNTWAMDSEALAWYGKTNLRVIPYASQAGGFFAHPYDKSGPRFREYHSPINHERWQRVHRLAERLGESPNAVALAYLLNHPHGGVAIAGPHTPAQMDDTCRAADIALSPADLLGLEAGDARETA